jgi:hypothetical protein
MQGNRNESHFLLKIKYNNKFGMSSMQGNRNQEYYLISGNENYISYSIYGVLLDIYFHLCLVI